MKECGIYVASSPGDIEYTVREVLAGLEGRN